MTIYEVSEDTSPLPNINDFQLQVVPIFALKDRSQWFIWKLFLNDRLYHTGETIFQNPEDASSAAMGWLMIRFDWGITDDNDNNHYADGHS